MSRKYRNPPIKEAICDIRFESASDWEFSSPIKLYEAIRDEYDSEPRQIALGGVEIQQDVQNIRVQQSAAQTEVSDVSQSKIARFGVDFLSIHSVGKYPGWKVFRSRISRLVDEYDKISMMGNIKRIGIRYVNHIDVGLTQFELSDYFTRSPDVPESLDMEIHGFLLRIDSLNAERAIRLNETFASVASDGKSLIALDLDVSRIFSEGEISPLNVMSHVDELRDFEREAFESLITDKSREIFGVYN